MADVRLDPRNQRTTYGFGPGEEPEPLRLAQTRPIEMEEPPSDGFQIEINPDGGVDIVYPAPAIHTRDPEDLRKHFDDNLADGPYAEGVLQNIAHDYLDGVAADVLSRTQFISNYNKGIDLLGLKIEEASSGSASGGTLSKVKHPALLEACVRSQSLARGQLLPAEGPARIENVGQSDSREDKLAKGFEDDFNYYLKHVAKEYYPSTDQALFYRAFGGTMFKKVYRCPLRRRPVSDPVQLTNLIISEDALDPSTAERKTNEIEMSPNDVRRMQVRGGWRDIHLAQPMVTTNLARRKVLESQGILASTTRSQDIAHTIYEGYVYLVPEDYGIEEPNAPSDYPLPYKVVLDKDSYEILALYRNWKPDDETLQERQVFVKYGLVPGLGFLDYGFLHLIGNQARVLTAGWQIMTDHGMLTNFPAGLKAKGVKMGNNNVRPSIGEYADIDIGNKDDIRKALLPLTYGTLDTSFFNTLGGIEDGVRRMAGTLEIETGGNRTNVPVGTILAMIEQQGQDLTAVHQRDHRSQYEELNLLRELFVEYPEDLRWMARPGGKSKEELYQEFNERELVPASDPNVPSQTHRVLLNMFLSQMAEKFPQLFVGRFRKLGERILTSIGISDAADLIATEEEIAQAAAAQNKQGGGSQAGQAQLEKAKMEMPLRKAELALKAQDIQAKGAQIQAKIEEQKRMAANQAEDNERQELMDRMEMDIKEAEQDLAEADLELKREELAIKREELEIKKADVLRNTVTDRERIAHEREEKEKDRKADKETAKLQAKERPRLQRPAAKPKTTTKRKASKAK